MKKKIALIWVPLAILSTVIFFIFPKQLSGNIYAVGPFIILCIAFAAFAYQERKKASKQSPDYILMSFLAIATLLLVFSLSKLKGDNMGVVVGLYLLITVIAAYYRKKVRIRTSD